MDTTYPHVNSTYSSAHSIIQHDEAVLDRWLVLQKKIKKGITLNEITSQNQKNSISTFKEYIAEYYKIKLKARECFENMINIDNIDYKSSTLELINADAEKTLKDDYNIIENFLFILRNDYQYVLKIVSLIDEKEYGKEDTINTIVDLLCHQFFENILIPNPENEELLILCYLLLEREIQNMTSATISSFIDESTSFVGRFLKSYTKKQELKTYVTMKLGSLIVKIENNAEACLDLNQSRIAYYYLKSKKRSTWEEGVGKEKARNLFADHEILTKKIPKSQIVSQKKHMVRDCSSEMLLNFNSIVNSQQQVASPKIATGTTSANDNDFYLGVVDFECIKYEESDEYNNDYMIDLNKDELNGRIKKATDENLKEFCIYK